MVTVPHLIRHSSDPRGIPAAVVPRRPAGLGDGALGAIDDMLDRLESVTRAGQQYLMHKIVGVLDAHPVAASGGPFVARRLDDLRREAGKASPDGGAFALTARAMMTTLRAAR